MTPEIGATVTSAVSCAMAFVIIALIDGDYKFALIYCTGGFVALFIRTVVFCAAVARFKSNSC